MKKVTSLLIAALILAQMPVGALAQTYSSESYYNQSEAMTSGTVQRCRVLGVRQITLQGTGQAGYFGGQQASTGQQIGGLLGAVAGALLGGRIGRGNGRMIATAVAGAAGGMIGSNIGARYSRRIGLQYSLLLPGNREITVEENLNRGDRVVPTGATCRLVQDQMGLRVLPADYLPQRVPMPQTSTFYGN